MEPFKNIYNKKSMTHFSQNIKAVHPKFSDKAFLKLLFAKLEGLEMKDRVKLIAVSLHDSLELDYRKSIDIFIKALADEPENTHEKWEQNSQKGIHSFMVWPLTYYVEKYGLDDLEYSMYALREMTIRFTSEFSIRPFLLKYDQKVFSYLNKWKKDKNHHVRRLVTEGTRPNLPWGIKVDNINEKLQRNIKLISSLKSDPSEYVRRSVANHLNDISRLDEKLYFESITTFEVGNENIERVIRHSARSLLKAAHPKILRYYGYKTSPKLKVISTVSKKKLKEGDSIELSVDLINHSKNKLKLLIDYEIFYLKNNGTHSPKVFKLKEIKLSSSEKLSFTKKIHFKKVTTRKHYSGKHFIALKINGKLYNKTSFQLIT